MSLQSLADQHNRSDLLMPPEELLVIIREYIILKNKEKYSNLPASKLRQKHNLLMFIDEET